MKLTQLSTEQSPPTYWQSELQSELTYPWLPGVTLPANLSRDLHMLLLLQSDRQVCKNPELADYLGKGFRSAS